MQGALSSRPDAQVLYSSLWRDPVVCVGSRRIFVEVGGILGYAGETRMEPILNYLYRQRSADMVLLVVRRMTPALAAFAGNTIEHAGPPITIAVWDPSDPSLPVRETIVRMVDDLVRRSPDKGISVVGAR